MEEARHRGAQECGPRALHAGAVREQTRSQSRAVVSRPHAPTKCAAVGSMVEASVTLPRCGNAQVRAKSAPRLTDFGGRSSRKGHCHGGPSSDVRQEEFPRRFPLGAVRVRCGDRRSLERPRVTSTDSSSSSARCMDARTSASAAAGIKVKFNDRPA